jgi:hypothetical protein
MQTSSLQARVNNKASVTFGIGLRDCEVNTVDACLKSLGASIRFSGINSYVIALCFNGEYANVKNHIMDGGYLLDKHYRVLESEKGLINAQRLIVNSFKSEYYFFLDSDSVVEEGDVYNMLLSLEDDDVQLVYATNKFFDPSPHKGFVSKIFGLYSSGIMLTPRLYFHGRFFGTKTWHFPVLSSDNDFELDDVYLSLYLIREFGATSIREVKDAVVISWPIIGFHEWYSVYRRTHLEFIKIIKYDPTYRSILKKIKRKTEWVTWLGATPETKLSWIVYIIFLYTFKLEFFLENIFVNMYILKKSEQWKIVWSTKRAIE